MSLELSLIKRVKELEAANGKLTEKVYTLQELLGLSKEENSISNEWGLSAQERRVFVVLDRNSNTGTVDGRDRIASHGLLITAAFYEQDEPDYPEWALRVIITKMRKKLTPHGFKIKPVYGMGYFLEKPAKTVIYGL